MGFMDVAPCLPDVLGDLLSATLVILVSGHAKSKGRVGKA
jgi:hypothetical protein